MPESIVNLFLLKSRTKRFVHSFKLPTPPWTFLFDKFNMNIVSKSNFYEIVFKYKGVNFASAILFIDLNFK